MPKRVSNRAHWLCACIALALATFACNIPISEEPPPATLAPPTMQAILPTSEPLPPPAATPEPDVSFEGISFSFDALITDQVIPEFIPAQQDPDLPEWEHVSNHYEFHFQGYVLAETFHDPRIIIYPIADLIAQFEYTADTVAALQQLLANRPAIPDDHLPFLPSFNAAQLFRTQAAFVDFQNGSGIRYLTQYGQAASPINSHELFYTFQGISADNQYYVAAILPVAHPSLPADGSQVPGGDWAAFSEGFMQYALDMQGQLQSQDPSSFNPSLLLLDSMIQTILTE